MKQTFKSFLLEAEVSPFKYTELSDEELLEKIKGEYSDAFKAHFNGGAIYRGWSRGVVNGEYDPGSGTRKSQNTSNYYTVLFDTNPANSKYPKRSKSFICSSNIGMAEAYGNTMAVLPINGATIGVCPFNDIWRTKTEGQIKLDIETLNRLLGKLTDEPISYQEFVKLIDGVDTDDIRRHLDRYMELRPDDDIPDFVEHWKKLYDYDAMGFQIVRSGDTLPKNREVWLSDKCLQVDPKKMATFYAQTLSKLKP